MYTNYFSPISDFHAKNNSPYTIACQHGPQPSTVVLASSINRSLYYTFLLHEVEDCKKTLTRLSYITYKTRPTCTAV